MPYLFCHSPYYICQLLNHQINTFQTWFSEASNLCLDYCFKCHVRSKESNSDTCIQDIIINWMDQDSPTMNISNSKSNFLPQNFFVNFHLHYLIRKPLMEQSIYLCSPTKFHGVHTISSTSFYCSLKINL